MSEEKLSSSNKLDIEAAERLSAEEKLKVSKETYRAISEDIGLSHGKLVVYNGIKSDRTLEYFI